MRPFLLAARRAPRAFGNTSRFVPRASSAVTQQSRHRIRPAPRWLQLSSFHTSQPVAAGSPTADELMENLNDLYATAKDEFEIAYEETEKKTIYAQDDRDAAREALSLLKEAFEEASKASAPDVAKEVQTRVGPRIRELENAVEAMEQGAMED